jgi:hypothetical protein
MKMTRQDEFKQELFALFRKYKVEMHVIENVYNYWNYVDGVNFFSYTQYDEDGNEIAAMIDLTLGTWENGEE